MDDLLVAEADGLALMVLNRVIDMQLIYQLFQN